ncbi:unnamed protein product [Candida verbasci]|uniref:Major facilitator superfamily (MFS) profile domain-containing protein n=1 Tax=Candida verbasci TaxID=1227364 RepID=A0A9W4XBX8_9ASCO|nr:unnamed protein product [Candida verbasci]
MHLIKSLIQSSSDIRILWCSVIFRMASYGLTNQVLTLYLKSININEFKIGIFMTCTLIGDTLISYYLTWNADRIGRKAVMGIGAIMMIISGIIFAICENFYILLIAAILGVISPSGDETGPFKSIEEASIAHLTPFNHLPEVFAFYGLFATVGAAVGSLFSGFIVDYCHEILNYDTIVCYKIVFLVYSGIAFAKCLLISCCLSNKCELNNSESTELITKENNKLLSETTKHQLFKLLGIFMLDSLGYGFLPSAWIVYYLKFTFKCSATTLGTLFFITNSVDAISSLPSAYLTKLLGPVKAILFTQVPSALIFSFIPICVSFVPVAILLLFYYLTTTMDVVPRQLLLTSIIPNDEFTKVLGIVNVGKTFARCVGPIFTGKLASKNKLHFGFFINSICVLLADSILAVNFLQLDQSIKNKHKLHKIVDVVIE